MSNNPTAFDRKTARRVVEATRYTEGLMRRQEGVDYGTRPRQGDTTSSSTSTGRPTGLFKVLVAPNGVDAHGPVYNVFDNADTGLTTPLGIALSPDPLSRWRGAGLPVGAAAPGSPGVAHYEGLTLVLDLVGETMCAGDGGFPAETG